MMPVDMSSHTCYGLQQAFMSDEDSCRAACCTLGYTDGSCDVYQWCPNTTKGCAAGPAVGTAAPSTCWIGLSNASDSKDPTKKGCVNATSGFSGGARTAPWGPMPPPPPPPGPTPPPAPGPPVCVGKCNVCSACCKPYLKNATDCKECVTDTCDKPQPPAPPPPPPGDWIRLLKLSLQNYALAKAGSAPAGFVCSNRGVKPMGCHCWNAQGNPMLNGNDCDQPMGCLMYAATDTGAFHFDGVNQSQYVARLGQWGVPSSMMTDFKAAALTSSADFKTFDFTEDGTTGTYVAHVGSVRLDSNTSKIYVGYTFGNAVGSLVKPMVRHVHAGDCHGTQRGMVPRGFTSDEITRINQGLQAEAFKKAASQCV